jgi:hypothetical protein
MDSRSKSGCLLISYLPYGVADNASKKQKATYHRSSCNIICCDFRYGKNVGKHGLEQWSKRTTSFIANSSTTAIINNEHTGKTSYLDQIT